MLTSAKRLEGELRRAIVSLEMPPGMRLSETDVAERHNVSRQPVREALIGLARTRLVEIVPQRGTVVAKISVSQLNQARFIREAVETAIVARCCAGFDPASRARIDPLIERQRRAAVAGDQLSFQRYDEMFHLTLAEGAGLPMAWDALRDIKAHMDRACHLTLTGPDTMMALVDQHEAIVRAIDARDATLAADAMRAHLREILRALPQVELDHPDLFER